MDAAVGAAANMRIKMFTTDNTDGYTTEQLAALNAELAKRLVGVDDADRADVEKAFADEVAGR